MSTTESAAGAPRRCGVGKCRKQQIRCGDVKKRAGFERDAASQSLTSKPKASAPLAPAQSWLPWQETTHKPSNRWTPKRGGAATATGRET
eukprot:scaffold150027_cov24-Tisochrysis_lutea.AAC.2